MSSGPGRTRRSEPRWGEASGYCRAIRLPGGRRREGGEPFGLALSRFERFWWNSTAGALGPLRSVPSLCSKRETGLIRIRQRPPGRRPRLSVESWTDQAAGTAISFSPAAS